MKTNLLRLLGLVSLISIFSAPSAHAYMWGVLGGVGKYDLTAGSTGGSGTTDSKFSPMGGLGLFFPRAELDVLYITKAIASGTTLNSVEVPLFYRLHLGSNFRLGLGGFADFSTTDVGGLQKFDYGLAGSLQFHTAMSGRTSFLVDARYLFGLPDLPGNSRFINILVGVVFH